MPFRRANTVLVCTTLPADSALRRVVVQLERRGYRVHQTAATLQLTTEPGIEAGGTGWPLVIQVSPVAGGLELTGRYRMPELPGQPEFPAEFLGFDWSPAKISFRQVEKTALAVPAATIRYSRK